MTKKIIPTYAVIFALLVLFSYLFIDKNFLYLNFLYNNFSSHRLLLTVIYLLFLVILFTFYYYLARRTENRKINMDTVKKIMAITSSILLLSYPAMLSYDIFSYIAYAKVFTVYHENPYIIMPYQFLHDPILQFTRYANLTLQYGPSWLFLSVIPYVLGFNHYLLILFNFKLLAVLFYLGTAYLIFRLSNKLLSVVLFALNPLVLLQILVSGHNDIVMMFFAILSYFLVQKKHYFLALLTLLISIGVKFITVLLIPIILYAIYQQMKKKSINWPHLYLYSGILMTVAFLLSFIHREIYPWYVVWMLVFSVLIPERKLFFYMTIALSITMLLTDIPDMLMGTYTPIGQTIKLFLALSPLFLSLLITIYFFSKKRLGRQIT